ncbi:ADP-L-glycero-D-manno-heptose-6-epimerase [Planctomycetales bacterium]|nr:ADP-L-glycero-D-manno-heptose-6-epimerase [Planctomycetales bacterium]
MHYLITGAAGFIGSNLVKTLNERGVSDIIAVDEMTDGDKHQNLADCQIADFIDLADFGEICARFHSLGNIKAVIHNGACADTMENNGRLMMAKNFTYAKNVFYWCRRFNLPFVYASSASVYGVGKISREEPQCERPINMYAYSKLAFDQFIRKNIAAANNTVVGLRYFNVYGARETTKGKMASMVSQLYWQLRAGGEAKLFTGTDGYPDGGQMRDFVNVRDVANVDLFFADRPTTVKGIFNVGTGKARSFNEVAQLLIKRLGRGKIEYVPFPEKLAGKYQSFTEADLTALRAAGYDADFLPLEKGIDCYF